MAYDRDIGMLYFYVVLDSENARGVGPIGSCPGDPACPGADELDTDYSCPPQGCINDSVELAGAYTPGTPNRDALAGGSVYTCQGGRYALPVPANQNRLVHAVKSVAGPGPNVRDGEIVQANPIADNGEGFSHSMVAKAPLCQVTTK